ncbi:1-(5-phosphoribosyl)-5-[(5-phosphoribosylamino)methylideneamino]imidazole-4-carboxamide isomerase [Fulvivirga sedimenti]|uniref:1-(5-phosphoribosyl)-5-[(5-phosphoribosylamino)methylideneamino] imidazole-4-carboxamide isomerase n=1 Tax=Fulvivirga sedimenti TaxID=2879465 RepID=A0A9X1HQ59_9BACT|nr:1-(5-phosphoribosyl)-5-[(5-phosphoribosylamino)methylideneamino]imidazole-4-carboxamide isomerase [Fulvivirga sedimenti]MCA6075175.1 1-(5-phosphoribosyl)-5-[(5-phosphoribosylamino)methylideneamino]imidazole-4-carboxamide isomerase [Fulvivirga sedimenti]MCA6076352.1 1-(5-phosphoribosyl)-5-[(5-phosphoribosylamino)methylideneamino]imidazole-4-carboxamide isomerase [Fulvivirga sedimenti]MCA6077480.1 1-(5-phosphoribosyl)-5-[(5-phosphoribosylamino)methylideneamino]imidazole-4-carboxamide isomerase 
MRIIPAIDIIDGKCVRLSQGDYSQKTVYADDPLEVARQFQGAGLKYLHLVDLDGAKSGGIVNWKVLESITSKTDLIVDFGGGIKKGEDIKIALNAGATQVTCGSIAVKNPAIVYQWLENYGPNKLILGADVNNGMIAVHGWTEKTTLSIEDLIHSYIAQGMDYVICTDIATDGMLKGPNFKLYNDILEIFPHIHLIASGGVTTMDDLLKLKENGLEGAIVGKAIYEGKISLKDLATFQDA